MKKINLYYELFEQHNVPECIVNIKSYINNSTLYKTDVLADKKCNNINLYSIQIIPDYLSIKYKPQYQKKTVKEFRKGYAAKLTEFDSAESYVKSQIGKNAKVVFKRLKRLENTFEISYDFLYGTIEKENYNAIMGHLKSFLISRFKQKQDSNFRLNEWDKLYENAFNLINENKASFFIIYNGNLPIAISLQYHFKDILISSIPSYNIDYHSFGLGAITQLKQLEWCFSNNYKILDVGHGDLDFKKRWSNLIYTFDHHIVYSKNNFLAILLANLEFSKIKAKNFLKSQKTDVLLGRAKQIL